MARLGGLISVLVFMTGVLQLTGQIQSKGITTVLDESRPSPLKQCKGSIGKVKVTIQWGSPSVKGREVWGILVPYNEVWRAGANEATTIEFDKDVLINSKKLKAGKYGFFCIPGTDQWTLIFNSVWNQWGAFEYDESKDVLRIDVKPENFTMNETLEYIIESNGISLVWEKLRIKFTVKTK